MLTAEQHFTEAHRTMDALQAELARSVYMNEADRSVLVGAVTLDAAVIFEGEPGIGKTKTAKATADAMGGRYGRVQGTPDLLPGDITGSETYDPRTSDFNFHAGPVFSNVFFVDEVNRANTRTQSALLEAMEERQVTVSGKTYPLPSPFVALATQNPNETGQGTYPLPVASLDRFAIGIGLRALSAHDRIAIHQLITNGHVPTQVTDIERMQQAKLAIKHLPDTPEMYARANRIIDSLRAIDVVDLGASLLGGYRPFGHILSIAGTQALIAGDQMVSNEHIDLAAKYVLPHRIQVTFEAEDKGITSRQLVDEVTARI